MFSRGTDIVVLLDVHKESNTIFKIDQQRFVWQFGWQEIVVGTKRQTVTVSLIQFHARQILALNNMIISE